MMTESGNGLRTRHVEDAAHARFERQDDRRDDVVLVHELKKRIEAEQRGNDFTP